MEQKQKDDEHLSRAEQLQVCVWLAELRRPFEVVKLIESTFNKQLDWNSVIFYRRSPRWRKIITRYEQRFLDKLLDIPIANKAVRIRRYETLYQEAMTEHTVAWTKDGDPLEGVDLNTARAVLVAARQEVEGASAVPGAVASAEVNVNLVSYVDGLKQIVQSERVRVLQTAPATNGAEHGNGAAE